MANVTEVRILSNRDILARFIQNLYAYEPNLSISFLVTTKGLYKSVCPSVCPSVGRSVGRYDMLQGSQIFVFHGVMNFFSKNLLFILFPGHLGTVA